MVRLECVQPNRVGLAMLACLGLIGSCLLVVGASRLQEDLEHLAEQVDENQEQVRFDEDSHNYDMHSDKFYYVDDLVKNVYLRKNYQDVRTTKAGQAPNDEGRSVMPAVNPFAVAQRTFKGWGSIMDRWDVKDTTGTSIKVQYLALYHGHGKPLVVNKLRAHLLRNLANAVNDYIPQLERLGEDDADDEPTLRDEVLKNIQITIEDVFSEVDESIRNSMAGSDDSYATATVVVVCGSYIITIGVGDGRVLAYRQDTKIMETVSLTNYKDDESLMNVFGAKKSRDRLLQTHVEFYRRRENNYDFLIIETPAMANAVPDMEETTKLVLNRIIHFATSTLYEDSVEQEMYEDALTSILKRVEASFKTQTNILKRVEASLKTKFSLLKHSDYSVMLVGLNRDYVNIH